MKRNLINDRLNESIIFILIIALSIVIGVRNSSYFSMGNFIDIGRSIITVGIFAMGVLIVIISGGIDVSFPAIAVFSMYATTKLFLSLNWQGNVFLPFIVAALIGFGLGMVNAFIIVTFNIPTFIATLGTQSVFSGALLIFVGTTEINNPPPGFDRFYMTGLVSVTNENGVVSSLPVAFLFFLVIVILTWFILTRTMIGKSIYAFGGDRAAAERIGFNLKKTQYFIFGYVGTISGIAGLIHTTMMRTSAPFDLLGSELDVIAAVVLGGASLSAGGYGSVLGTILGVLLLTICKTNLIMMGVSSYWQKLVLGILILLGTGLTAFQKKKALQKLI